MENTETKKINIGKKATVLIVDDDPVIRMLLEGAFKDNEKYKVISLESSGKALENLIDYKYDILLLDGNMPGISGFELLKYCKKNHPYMEVIMVSGNQDMKMAIDTIKNGAFDYIQKPFTIPHVLETVERALDKQKNEIENDFLITENLSETKLKIFPDYKVLKTIGAGTMGIVYLLQNKNDENDKKALKILKNEDTENISQSIKIERFLREAKIMKNITNSHIVKIYDSGFYEDKTSFILMEYVDGSVLTDFIKKNQLPTKQRVFIIGKLAAALFAVHKKGILHRDIKPGNVVLTKQLEPKLLDFGIARTVDSSLTMEHEVLGSPAYMSPEGFAISSSKLTPQSDIFSLGVLAYELLTGQKPFIADTINEITQAIQYSKPIAPSKINPEVSEKVERVIGKMLEKQLADRYYSADQIIAELAESENQKVTSLFRRILRKNPKNYWATEE